MARPAKSPEEHEARGNPGRRKLDVIEGATKTLPAEMPHKPKWLNKDAAEHWDEMAQGLYDQGLLTRFDSALFAAYCQAVGTAIDAERRLARGGKTIKLSQGSYTKRPEVDIARAAWKQASELGAQFGLTAKARKGLNIKLKPPVKETTDATTERKARVLSR